VILRARGESWIQLRDTRANTVLADRVLRNGETVPVPNREGMVLTTGKAENLDILLDGQVTAALANATGVRRGIQLDPERLRPAAEPTAPAAAPAQPAPRPPARP
jgi:cytoskeleton protein RodZ